MTQKNDEEMEKLPPCDYVLLKPPIAKCVIPKSNFLYVPTRRE